MSVRSIPLPDLKDCAAALYAERIGRFERIASLAEAAGKSNLVAFGLAIRFDLPLARVEAALPSAPSAPTVDELADWLDAIPTRPSLEIVK